jgi:hypothetical protein
MQTTSTKPLAGVGRRFHLASARFSRAVPVPIILGMPVRGDREIAQPACMQAAFQNAHHGARRNIKVVFLPPFPDAPNRRPEAARVSDSKANDKFTLSISHLLKTNLSR